MTGYDEVIDKLKSLSDKQLTKTQRQEINQMLKDIDKTNIGAFKNVDKAIERLQTKKEKTEEIFNKHKLEEKS